MCAKCRDSVMETFFALDRSDGHYMFCAICGEGGQLMMCESPDCGRFVLAWLHHLMHNRGMSGSYASRPEIDPGMRHILSRKFISFFC